MKTLQRRVFYFNSNPVLAVVAVMTGLFLATSAGLWLWHFRSPADGDNLPWWTPLLFSVFALLLVALTVQMWRAWRYYGVVRIEITAYPGESRGTLRGHLVGSSALARFARLRFKLALQLPRDSSGSDDSSGSIEETLWERRLDVSSDATRMASGARECRIPFSFEEVPAEDDFPLGNSDYDPYWSLEVRGSGGGPPLAASWLLNDRDDGNIFTQRSRA